MGGRGRLWETLGGSGWQWEAARCCRRLLEAVGGSAWEAVGGS